MENVGIKIGRIVEPFVKVSYSMWIIDKGAISVNISVDGAEPNPEQVAEILVSKGYVREPLATSNVSWTGRFSLRGKVEVIVSGQPGVDIAATFENKRLLVAECKGELTPTAIRSGLDRTAFYTAIGQLIIICGNLPAPPQQKVIVLADTDRFRALARYAVQNNTLKQIGLSFALVDLAGNVSEVQPS
jgi:hypothetical protein